MVLPNKTRNRFRSLAFAALSSLFFMPMSVMAQNGLPLPGSSFPAGSVNAPTPGSTRTAPVAGIPSYAAPTPGAPSLMGAPVAAAPVRSGYQALPLNPGNAIARLEELRNMMPNSRPKDFQDSIGEYCDWLSDMADAHWKLAQSFAKSDATKVQADNEKQLCLKFGSLRRQAMLLKAEFLIRQKRYPEALGPLVDIVVAEPRTETGVNAYRLLQEIGFSEELPAKVETAVAPTKPTAAPKSPETAAPTATAKPKAATSATTH